MNEATQAPVEQTVQLTNEQIAKLNELTERLNATGEVLVQTEETVGNEDEPRVVH